MQDKTVGNFKTAPWFEKSQYENISVIGLGGIGSNALYCLAKTIPGIYTIVDPDVVEAHNIGTQFYENEDINFYKVMAMKAKLNSQTTASFWPTKRRASKEEVYPITVAALDNMESRKEVFQWWKQLQDREILVEGRLTADHYEIHVVTPGREEEYEKTLFDSDEATKQPCTYKQTAYFGMLIGARITHILVNYLTNKYAEEPYCTLPFKVEEFGPMFYINIQN